eukprot:Nk52_evm31s2630 gene=Nk52_evmTU31s2630
MGGSCSCARGEAVSAMMGIFQKKQILDLVTLNDQYPMDLSFRCDALNDIANSENHLQSLKLFCQTWNTTFGWHLDLGQNVYNRILKFKDVRKVFWAGYEKRKAEAGDSCLDFDTYVYGLVKMIVKAFTYITVMNSNPTALHIHFRLIGARHAEMHIEPFFIDIFSNISIMCFFEIRHIHRTGLNMDEMIAWRNIQWLLVNSMTDAYLNNENCKVSHAHFIFHRIFIFYPNHMIDKIKQQTQLFVTNFTVENRFKEHVMVCINSVLQIQREKKVVISFREGIEDPALAIANLWIQVASDFYDCAKGIGEHVKKVFTLQDEINLLLLFRELSKALYDNEALRMTCFTKFGLMTSIIKAIQDASPYKNEIVRYLSEGLYYRSKSMTLSRKMGHFRGVDDEVERPDESVVFSIGQSSELNPAVSSQTIPRASRGSQKSFTKIFQRTETKIVEETDDPQKKEPEHESASSHTMQEIEEDSGLEVIEL